MRKQNQARRNIEIAKFFAIVVIAAALLLFIRFAPDWVTRFYPPCLFHSLTKIYCPGCGISRALIALVNFDFANAFVYNPFLFIIIIPFLIYMSCIYLLRATRGGNAQRTPSILSTPKAIVPVAIVIVILWVVRNIFPPA